MSRTSGGTATAIEIEEYQFQTPARQQIGQSHTQRVRCWVGQYHVPDPAAYLYESRTANGDWTTATRTDNPRELFADDEEIDIRNVQPLVDPTKDDLRDQLPETVYFGQAMPADPSEPVFTEQISLSRKAAKQAVLSKMEEHRPVIVDNLDWIGSDQRTVKKGGWYFVIREFTFHTATEPEECTSSE